MKAFLKAISGDFPKVLLPDNIAVVLGRGRDLDIKDPLCSRKQVELTANYNSKYVLVRRLGANPSQIDGIDIPRNATSRLNPGQHLHISSNKYHVVFHDKQPRNGNGDDLKTIRKSEKIKLKAVKRTKVSVRNEPAERVGKFTKFSNDDLDDDDSDSPYSFQSPVKTLSDHVDDVISDVISLSRKMSENSSSSIGNGTKTGLITMKGNNSADCGSIGNGAKTSLITKKGKNAAASSIGNRTESSPITMKGKNAAASAGAAAEKRELAAKLANGNQAKSLLDNDVSSSKVEEKTAETASTTGNGNQTVTSNAKTSSNGSSTAVSKSRGHWSTGLQDAMKDESAIVEKDDQVVIIKDKYPKAKYHWLVLPTDDIKTTKQLRSEHIPLVEKMIKMGKDVASRQDTTETFRVGFHAIASMSHLHLHVISQDFDSPCLKNKRHWNSFTTDYFVNAEDILMDLKRDGKVADRSATKELLTNPLRCHRCSEIQKNMPALKRHIATCKK